MLEISSNLRKFWEASYQYCFIYFIENQVVGQLRFLSFSWPWFHKLTFVSLSRSFTDVLLLILGFYGQLQTFCPPHYADTQKNIQHSVSCDTVPPVDCSAITSVGQAGLGTFRQSFSDHSGIKGK